MSVKQLLSVIETVITCQTVKWDNKTYLMSKGISQAVSLSASLCKLYLAHLDQTHLSAFTISKGDMLLRAVDDYLYITSEKNNAEKFLARMVLGFDDYGIFINKAKTQSNLHSHAEIYYYGYLFNTDNLEVYVKYAQCENISFKNLLTFNKWDGPEQGYSFLRNKMKRIPSYKLNRLTTNSSYMTPKGLARNVFETACLMACCYKTIVNTLYHEADPAQLIDIVNYCAVVVTRKVGANDGLSKKDIYWIVIRAFKMCMNINVKSEIKWFPECILPYLEEQESKAKMNSKLELKTMIYGIVDELPKQYRSGH